MTTDPNGLMPEDAAPSGSSSRTPEHPTIRRLLRQARQFDHASNQANNQTAANMLRMQHSLIVVVATLGMDPTKWDEIAEQMIDVNVSMLAEVVAAGVTTLPPAQHDHD